MVGELGLADNPVNSSEASTRFITPWRLLLQSKYLIARFCYMPASCQPRWKVGGVIIIEEIGSLNSVPSLCSCVPPSPKQMRLKILIHDSAKCNLVFKHKCKMERALQTASRIQLSQSFSIISCKVWMKHELNHESSSLCPYNVRAICGKADL